MGQAAFVVGGIDLQVISDLEFIAVGMKTSSEARFSPIYATVKSKDPTQAVAAFFDITLYDKDDRVIERSAANVYVLPRHASMLYGLVEVDFERAERMVIEQTRLTLDAPVVNGWISIDDLFINKESGRITGDFATTLSPAPRYVEIFMAAFVRDRLVAACYDSPDIPDSGTFEVGCSLEPLSQEVRSSELKIPEDAKYEIYLVLSTPL